MTYSEIFQKLRLYIFKTKTFQVQPYLYQLILQTVVVTEGDTANLECELLVGTEASQTINWIWATTVSNPNLNATQSTNQTYSRLVLVSALQSYSGDYSCTASNEYGSYSRTIKLIVKSNQLHLFFVFIYKFNFFKY